LLRSSIAEDEFSTQLIICLASQVAKNVGSEIHSLMASPLPSTTPTMQAVFNVMLLAATISYFSYGMSEFLGLSCREHQRTGGKCELELSAWELS
jgi:hypothetical protein